MLLKVGDPGIGRVAIKDAHGKTIPFVIAFDTETREVTMLVQAVSPDGNGRQSFAVGDGQVLEAKFIAPGAWAEDKDGNRLRDPNIDMNEEVIITNLREIVVVNRWAWESIQKADASRLGLYQFNGRVPGVKAANGDSCYTRCVAGYTREKPWVLFEGFKENKPCGCPSLTL